MKQKVGNTDDHRRMHVSTNAYIKPPRRIPLYLKLGILISKKVTKKDLLAPKLLAWYPKVAISSGVLESLVAHGKKDLNGRILKIVRIQASISVACPFCVDMNSFEYEKEGITQEEMMGLAGMVSLAAIRTFSTKERLAIEYTKIISGTPVEVPLELIEELNKEFSEREIVILASTAAQVNYWARMLVALGVPPAGFSETCDIGKR
jgi:alkylhydroperoxidase family enzyme